MWQKGSTFLAIVTPSCIVYIVKYIVRIREVLIISRRTYYQLNQQELENDKMEILKLCKTNFDECVALSEEPKLELEFYVRHIIGIILITLRLLLLKTSQAFKTK